MFTHTPFSTTNWNKASFRVQLARIRQVLMILVFVASLVGMNPTPVRADSGWTAYNDCGLPVRPVPWLRMSPPLI